MWRRYVIQKFSGLTLRAEKEILRQLLRSAQDKAQNDVKGEKWRAWVKRALISRKR